MLWLSGRGKNLLFKSILGLCVPRREFFFRIFSYVMLIGIKVLIVYSREFGMESIGKDSAHFDKELIHFHCHILLFQGNDTSGKHRLK